MIPQSEHLLPAENATLLEKAVSASDGRMLQVPHQIIRWAWDPDACPVHLLPYLAQAWSVDEWDPAWSEAQKRQVIRDSIWIHRHKGTIGALRRAIAQLGLGARVVRWFEQTPRARAYTFKLFVRLDPVTEWTSATARRLYRVAITNKAVRSHLDAIVVERDAPPPPVSLGLAINARLRLRLVIDPVRSIRPQRASIYVGALPVSTRHLRVAPRAA